MAEEALLKSLTLNSKDLSVRHHLATLFTALGRRKDAESELLYILELDPEHSSAKLDLAIHSLAKGQARKALDPLDEVLEKQPENTRALFYRAIIMEQLGFDCEAEEILQKLSQGPSDKYRHKAVQVIEQRKNRLTGTSGAE